MKARISASSIVMLLMMLMLVEMTRGQPSGFIINGADATSLLSTTDLAELNTLIANIEPHIVMQSANAARFLGLIDIPGDLQTLLGQVSDRFIIQYANAGRMHTLSYPASLIGDTLPPHASAISTDIIDLDSVKITWATDEFATSVAVYGMASGVYTQTVSDTLYYKSHVVILNGLISGNTYYYKIGSTDQSGNTYQSPEYELTVTTFVYLPLVKNH